MYMEFHTTALTASYVTTPWHVEMQDQNIHVTIYHFKMQNKTSTEMMSKRKANAVQLFKYAVKKC